ncbi:MAG: excisionase family DNA-binding protein [Anaerolineae bacterium]
MSEEKHWLTVAEAAKQSGSSIRTIQRWLEDGKIEGWKPGRDWFTTLDAVTEYKRKVKMGRPKKKSK